MSKKIRKHKRKKDFIFINFIIFLIAVILVVGILISYKSQILSSQKVSSKDSLQLGTFKLAPSPTKTLTINPTPTPTPTPKPIDCTPAADGTVSDPSCCGEVAIPEGRDGGYKCEQPCFFTDTGEQQCIAKPVIYLYPLKHMRVNVSIETSGEISVSDPLYPTGGWKNVLAKPGGDLEYQGKTYRELFYETNVADVKEPDKGLTLNSGNLKNELDNAITRLGLIGAEKAEFLDFWVPRLQKLGSKYVFFGIVEREEKDRIDKVFIEPRPDTMIEFIAYFAPIDTPFEGKKFELPSAPPARVGFTAVEWGGTVGN